MCKFKRILFAICFLLCAGTMALVAQPGGGPERRPDVGPDPQSATLEVSVRNTLDRLKPLLDLSDKQYDKLYKLLMKEVRIQSSMLRPVPPGPGAGPGAGPDGVRPHSPGERAGRPTVPPHGGPGMRPPHGNGPAGDAIDPAQAEKMKQKMDKKIRKILSDEQYVLWDKEVNKTLPVKRRQGR